MSSPKFEIGDRVRVDHHTCGSWEGRVVYRANAYDDMWEYEVTNAPQCRPEFPEGEGYRWHPLAWEEEVTKL